MAKLEKLTCEIFPIKVELISTSTLGKLIERFVHHLSNLLIKFFEFFPLLFRICSLESFDYQLRNKQLANVEIKDSSIGPSNMNFRVAYILRLYIDSS